MHAKKAEENGSGEDRLFRYRQKLNLTRIPPEKGSKVTAEFLVTHNQSCERLPNDIQSEYFDRPRMSLTSHVVLFESGETIVRSRSSRRRPGRHPWEGLYQSRLTCPVGCELGVALRLSPPFVRRGRMYRMLRGGPSCVRILCYGGTSLRLRKA